MTTIPAPSFGRLIPTREDLHRMWQHKSVAITIVLCGTLLASLVISGMIYLIAMGRPTEALTTFIGGGIAAMLGMVINRLGGLTKQVQQNGGNNGPVQ